MKIQPDDKCQLGQPGGVKKHLTLCTLCNVNAPPIPANMRVRRQDCCRPSP